MVGGQGSGQFPVGPRGEQMGQLLEADHLLGEVGFQRLAGRAGGGHGPAGRQGGRRAGRGVRRLAGLLVREAGLPRREHQAHVPWTTSGIFNVAYVKRNGEFYFSDKEMLKR